MLGHKILIIGCAGSGKTTLANQLATQLDLPIIHLDRFYWQKNWQPIDEDSWQKMVASLCEQSSWIMDGNYTSTLSMRIRSASAIIYLDLPRGRCLTRVIFRRFKFLTNRKRTDIPSNCKERLNLPFLKWIWQYPKRSRLKTLHLIKEANKPVYHLKSKSDIEKFLYITVKNRQ